MGFHSMVNGFYSVCRIISWIELNIYSLTIVSLPLFWWLDFFWLITGLMWLLRLVSSILFTVFVLWLLSVLIDLVLNSVNNWKIASFPFQLKHNSYTHSHTYTQKSCCIVRNLLYVWRVCQCQSGKIAFSMDTYISEMAFKLRRLCCQAIFAIILAINYCLLTENLFCD